jgi:hypothetical protein
VKRLAPKVLGASGTGCTSGTVPVVGYHMDHRCPAAFALNASNVTDTKAPEACSCIAQAYSLVLLKNSRKLHKRMTMYPTPTLARTRNVTHPILTRYGSTQNIAYHATQGCCTTTSAAAVRQHEAACTARCLSAGSTQIAARFVSVRHSMHLPSRCYAGQHLGCCTIQQSKE